ncbi:MAG: GDSL-type esterase/lipase family protein [Hasllibacter sp.]
MNLLAFGDSLTWGYRPEDGGRHAPEDRWPIVAADALGATVWAEGLNGRTTAHDEWTGAGDRNGARLLPTLIETHWPLDWVAVMLGTNDLLLLGAPDPMRAARGMTRIARLVRHHPARGGGAPHCLLIAPPPLREAADVGPRAVAASRRLAGLYADVAAEEGCVSLDAGGAAASSAVDGVHLDAANTRAIGKAVAGAIRAAG